MAQKTPKLHELLAVEGDLAATSKKLSDEAKVTFEKRADHFMGLATTVTMLDAARQGENTAEEKAMVSTVADKLNYLTKPVVKHFDAVLQKDSANQEATADLVVDGATLGENLPATFLLGLENHLKRLRPIYEAIPTLKPGLDWKKDENLGANVYKAPSQTSFRTEKVVGYQVLYEATKEHPAQIKDWTEDKPIGRVERTETSGMLSPADKAAILGRIDTLLRAVKRARQRANGQEVQDRHIGAALFGFIHGKEV